MCRMSCRQGFQAPAVWSKIPTEDRITGAASARASGPRPRAASLCAFAIGSETQNSIQTPSSVSSVFGFKPTVGLVSRAGMFPLVPSQDSPGPIARSIEDIALVMHAIAGADPRDAASMSSACLSFGSKSVQARAISRVRLGIPRRLFATKATELAVELEQFESAIAELTRAGAFIVD